MPKEVLREYRSYWGCEHCGCLFDNVGNAVEHEERYHGVKLPNEVIWPKYAVGDLVGFDGKMYLIRGCEWCKDVHVHLYTISKCSWFLPTTDQESKPFMFSYNSIKVYETDIIGKINKSKLIATTNALLAVHPFTAVTVRVMEGYGGKTITKLIPVIELGLGDE